MPNMEFKSVPTTVLMDPSGTIAGSYVFGVNFIKGKISLSYRSRHEPKKPFYGFTLDDPADALVLVHQLLDAYTKLKDQGGVL